MTAEHGSWLVEAEVEGFDDPWPVYVEGEDPIGDAPEGEPTAAQRETFKKWVKAAGARKRIEPLLLAYYREVVETGGFRAQMMPKDAARNAPVLKSRSQIWDLVGPVTSVELPRDPGEAGYDFQLRANCTWDEEHGLEMKVRDGKPVWEFRARTWGDARE